MILILTTNDQRGRWITFFTNVHPHEMRLIGKDVSSEHECSIRADIGFSNNQELGTSV